ncbi:uncharacterized protein LOC142784700 isoform X1 [Rhipicephalus microplus]|uniref:uncharacterized protein LOC142784700 isoform X1 n=1 Tax=Rhipicephalus microplus TaxID=6941 RepID=UPI003F6ADA8B
MPTLATWTALIFRQFPSSPNWSKAKGYRRVSRATACTLYTTAIAVTISEETRSHWATFRGDDTGTLPEPSSEKLKAAAFGGKVAGTQSAKDLPSTLARNAEGISSENRSTEETPTSTSEPSDRVSLDIPVLTDGLQVGALVDTGADYSIISGRLAKDLRKVITPWIGTRIRTTGGHVLTPLGHCTARVKIRASTFVLSCLVLRDCLRQLIIGMDFLWEYGAFINLRERIVTFSTQGATDREADNCRRPALRVADDSVTLPPRATVPIEVTCEDFQDGEVVAESNLSLLLLEGVCAAQSVVRICDGQSTILVTNFNYEHRHLFRGTTLAYGDPVADVTECFASEETLEDEEFLDRIDINSTLSDERKAALHDLLREFRCFFASSSKVRQTHLTKHRNITDDDVRPIRQQPYRVSAKKREAIQTQVKEMLDDGIIQPSSSAWSSPVVLVKKKDGTPRFCIDYRKLNSVTKKDVYPLPRFDDSFDRLRRAKCFSSIHLKSGHWQIEVDERDREKTAFVTPDGLYEFRVLPFGLCFAPANYQRMMDTVIAGLKWQSCLVYLDDVVIFFESFEEHLKRLRKVLEAIRTAELTLKPQKCHFGYEELKFLGHVISADRVRPDSDKTDAVAAFPVSSHKRAVRRFFGLCAYYRRFIANF